jgi:hypothetical protein
MVVHPGCGCCVLPQCPRGDLPFLSSLFPCIFALVSHATYTLLSCAQAFIVWLGIASDQILDYSQRKVKILYINSILSFVSMFVVSSGLLLYCLASLNTMATDGLTRAVVQSKAFTGTQRAALVQQMMVCPATLDTCGFAVTNARLGAFFVSIIGVLVPLAARFAVTARLSL